METLETLAKFVAAYPQLKAGKLQYAFLGGTAVRLNQEMVGVMGYDVRPISDFDIIVLYGGGNYPVHQCDLDKIFGVASLNLNNVLNYIVDTKIDKKKYWFMDGTFLTFTKTCAVDNPREKDFEDIALLYNLGLINFKRLGRLYESSDRITKNSKLIIDILQNFLEYQTQDKIKLFQTFPRLVNLVDEFPDYKKAMGKLQDHASQNGKNGYQLSSVLYDIHSIVREVENHNKMRVLTALLKIAKNNDYRDFDRLVHQYLLPKFRYSSKRKQTKLIKNLESN
ncbi:MAG: hypothetical protein QXI33_02445 [Candidatus Pacearchaeota archaeon]